MPPKRQYLSYWRRRRPVVTEDIIINEEQDNRMQLIRAYDIAIQHVRDLIGMAHQVENARPPIIRIETVEQMPSQSQNYDKTFLYPKKK